MTNSIPHDVARHLGYYVYLLVDPRTEKVFYVGKGQGERILDHLTANGESQRAATVNTLRSESLEPRLDILAHKLPDEETALRIEAAVIDLCGLGELTNKMRGWRSIQCGRVPLDELASYYAAKPVKITDQVLLIRIARLFRHGMSADELYDATRGIWKLGPRRNHVQYAFAVFEGVVREVYKIESWQQAPEARFKTNIHKQNQPKLLRAKNRWVFTGVIAGETVRSLYKGRSVAAYFRKGSRNPFKYVNVKSAI
jgi:hypothetical protein